jgi:hypothetical protein
VSGDARHPSNSGYRIHVSLAETRAKNMRLPNVSKVLCLPQRYLTGAGASNLKHVKD